MPELIEAAVRAGAHELAAETDRHLTDRCRASGTDWASGIAARSQALVVDDGRADDLYAEAIERLTRTRFAVDVARAHLLYGAARLFISPSTVEYHLHKAFRKLGVRSRTELARHME
jgi:hypothetical protein